jgi:hypothetical protein
MAVALLPKDARNRALSTIVTYGVTVRVGLALVHFHGLKDGRSSLRAWQSALASREQILLADSNPGKLVPIASRFSESIETLH